MKDRDLADPNFKQARKVHDWRNHVGKRTKTIWYTFTPSQKRALYEDAEALADREEWD